MLLGAAAAGAVESSKAGPEVVEFDLAAYNASDNAQSPDDAEAQIQINPDGTVRRKLGPGGSFSIVGTWLQGGGAPADATIYEVEYQRTSGSHNLGGPDDFDLQLTGARNIGNEETATGGSTWTGVISIKLVAGSVEQDTATSSITASATP